mmetsp:Transcript_25411/g.64499  ORF Transcript_25411/g.64499 Transcript_25411/m.64499 type:complete len:691 (+) Transcript_25411:547-2619(+)
MVDRRQARVHQALDRDLGHAALDKRHAALQRHHDGDLGAGVRDLEALVGLGVTRAVAELLPNVLVDKLAGTGDANRAVLGPRGDKCVVREVAEVVGLGRDHAGPLGRVVEHGIHAHLLHQSAVRGDRGSGGLEVVLARLHVDVLGHAVDPDGQPGGVGRVGVLDDKGEEERVGRRGQEVGHVELQGTRGLHPVTLPRRGRANLEPVDGERAVVGRLAVQEARDLQHGVAPGQDRRVGPERHGDVVVVAGPGARLRDLSHVELDVHDVDGVRERIEGSHAPGRVEHHRRGEVDAHGRRPRVDLESLDRVGGLGRRDRLGGVAQVKLDRDGLADLHVVGHELQCQHTAGARPHPCRVEVGARHGEVVVCGRVGAGEARERHHDVARCQELDGGLELDGDVVHVAGRRRALEGCLDGPDGIDDPHGHGVVSSGPGKEDAAVVGGDADMVGVHEGLGDDGGSPRRDPRHRAGLDRDGRGHLGLPVVGVLHLKREDEDAAALQVLAHEEGQDTAGGVLGPLAVASPALQARGKHHVVHLPTRQVAELDLHIAGGAHHGCGGRGLLEARDGDDRPVGLEDRRRREGDRDCVVGAGEGVALANVLGAELGHPHQHGRRVPVEDVAQAAGALDRLVHGDHANDVQGHRGQVRHARRGLASVVDLVVEVLHRWDAAQAAGHDARGRVDVDGVCVEGCRD